jgi:long-chain fatty acid transport protein
LFVPGFVAGALWSASSRWDFGAWYRMSDKIRAKGDLKVVWPYFTDAGAKFTDPSMIKSEDAVGKDAAKVTLTVPMEARIGARWHLPRKPATGLAAEKQRHDAYPTRDPLRDDLYDFELDLTWANNSAADNIQIRFPAGIAVNPGEVPENADRPTGYRDSFGARLGMQYNAIRDRMGVRVGSWLETSATDPDYLTVTGVAALRGGFGGGLVFRVGNVDAEMGYQHMWNAGLDNGGDGKIKAIAGSPPDSGYRSTKAVNGGHITQHADVFSIGAVARF